jgi:hypothetical protein
MVSGVCMPETESEPDIGRRAPGHVETLRHEPFYDSLVDRGSLIR